MLETARKIVEQCADLKDGEQALIVTDRDPRAMAVAEVLERACEEKNSDVVTCVMIPRTMHNQEVPCSVKQAMCASPVVFAPTTYAISQTEARKEACESGTRLIMIPDCSEKLMLSPAFDVNFEEIEPTVNKVADMLSKAETAILTSGKGTRLEISLRGRTGSTGTGMARHPGESAHPPDIEAAIAPVEGTAKGTLIIDGSVPVPGLGVLKHEIIKLEVLKGRIMKFTDGCAARALKELLSQYNTIHVYAIAELGIGLNPKATLRGSMLEDEGCRGTVHIGIGSNFTMGGSIRAPLHLDLVIRKPTLLLDDFVLLQEGRLNI